MSSTASPSDAGAAMAVNNNHVGKISFFSLSKLSHELFYQQVVLGFVEELAVEEDPEYQVVDSFRSARKSNEARQLLLHRLSAGLRASIARKVRSLGGNAVLGYQQSFDAEGDSGIVARAYGTAVRLISNPTRQAPMLVPRLEHHVPSGSAPAVLVHAAALAAASRALRGAAFHEKDSGTSKAFAALQQAHAASSLGAAAVAAVRYGLNRLVAPAEVDYLQAHGDGANDMAGKLSLPAGSPTGYTREAERSRSGTMHASDLAKKGGESDNEATPGRGPTTAAISRLSAGLSMPNHVHLVQHNFVHALRRIDDVQAGTRPGCRRTLKTFNVQIFSLTSIPPNTRAHAGGLVACRSVKYLGRLQAKAFDQETRDRWWNELREELKSHTAKLACTQVLGYRETVAICGDACVLSVSGTAMRLRNTTKFSHINRPSNISEPGILHATPPQEPNGRSRVSRKTVLEHPPSGQNGPHSKSAHDGLARRNRSKVRQKKRESRHWDEVRKFPHKVVEDIDKRSRSQAAKSGHHHFRSSHDAAVVAAANPAFPVPSTTTPRLLPNIRPWYLLPGPRMLSAVSEAAADAWLRSKLASMDGPGASTVADSLGNVNPAAAEAAARIQAQARVSPLTLPQPSVSPEHPALRSGRGSDAESSVVLPPPSSDSASMASLAIQSTIQQPLMSPAAGLDMLNTPTRAAPQSALVSIPGADSSAGRLFLQSREGANDGTTKAMDVQSQQHRTFVAIGDERQDRRVRQHDVRSFAEPMINEDPLGAPTGPNPAGQPRLPCSFFHVTYQSGRAPFNNMRVMQCRGCRRHWVPSVLLATVEPPENLLTTGPGVLVEARAVRRKDKSTGETECVRLSEELVFMEMQLHQQLLLKMKLIGRNACFTIRSSIQFNGTLIVGTMSGTAVYADALAPPPALILRRMGAADQSPELKNRGSALNAAPDTTDLATAIAALGAHHRQALDWYGSESTRSTAALTRLANRVLRRLRKVAAYTLLQTLSTGPRHPIKSKARSKSSAHNESTSEAMPHDGGPEDNSTPVHHPSRGDAPPGTPTGISTLPPSLRGGAVPSDLIQNVTGTTQLSPLDASNSVSEYVGPSDMALTFPTQGLPGSGDNAQLRDVHSLASGPGIAASNSFGTSKSPRDAGIHDEAATFLGASSKATARKSARKRPEITPQARQHRRSWRNRGGVAANADRRTGADDAASLRSTSSSSTSMSTGSGFGSSLSASLSPRSGSRSSSSTASHSSPASSDSSHGDGGMDTESESSSDSSSNSSRPSTGHSRRRSQSYGAGLGLTMEASHRRDDESDEDAADPLADDLQHYVVEIDDELAEDALAAVNDAVPPPGVAFLSIEKPLPLTRVVPPVHRRHHQLISAGPAVLPTTAVSLLLLPRMLPVVYNVESGSSSVEGGLRESLPESLPAVSSEETLGSQVKEGAGKPPASARRNQARFSPACSRPLNLQLLIAVLRMRWSDLSSSVSDILSDGRDVNTNPAYLERITQSGPVERPHLRDLPQASSAPSSNLPLVFFGDTNSVGINGRIAGSVGVPGPTPLSNPSPAVSTGGTGANSWYAGVSAGLAQAFGGLASRTTGFGSTHGHGYSFPMASHLHGSGYTSGGPWQGSSMPDTSRLSAAGVSNSHGVGMPHHSAPPGVQHPPLAPATDNEKLARLFHAVYGLLSFKLRLLAPATLCGLRFELRLPEPDTVEVLVTGMAIREVGIFLTDRDDDVALQTPFAEGALQHDSALKPDPLGIFQTMESNAEGGLTGTNMRSSTPVPQALLLGECMIGPACIIANPLLTVTGFPQHQKLLVPTGIALQAEQQLRGFVAQMRSEMASFLRWYRCLRHLHHLQRQTYRYHRQRSVAVPAAMWHKATASSSATASSAVLPESEQPVEDLGVIPPRSGALALSSVGKPVDVPPSATQAIPASSTSPGRATPSNSKVAEKLSRNQGMGEEGNEEGGAAIAAPGLLPGISAALDHAFHGQSVTSVTHSAPNVQQQQHYSHDLSEGPRHVSDVLDPPGTAHRTLLSNRHVVLTPISYVPGSAVTRYLGHISLTFIRESLAVRQGGGLSAFLQTFIAEANSVMRSMVASSGGNTLLNYRLTPRESNGRALRNQAYHLVTVSGDAAEVAVL